MDEIKESGKIVIGVFSDKAPFGYVDENGVVTALNPIIGYKNSTKIAKEALETGRSVYELILEHDILDKDDLDKILSPENMLKPVKLDIHPKH